MSKKSAICRITMDAQPAVMNNAPAVVVSLTCDDGDKLEIALRLEQVESFVEYLQQQSLSAEALFQGDKS